MNGETRKQCGRFGAAIVVRQPGDDFCRHPADAFGPCGVLGDAVGCSGDIRSQIREADGIFLGKIPIGIAFGKQHIEKRCHHGRIGARMDGYPMGGQIAHGAGSSRIDDNHRYPVVLAFADPGFDPGTEPGIRRIRPPEKNQFGMRQRGRIDSDLLGAE